MRGPALLRLTPGIPVSRAALSNSHTCSLTILSLEVLKTVFDFDGISPGQKQCEYRNGNRQANRGGERNGA